MPGVEPSFPALCVVPKGPGQSDNKARPIRAVDRSTPKVPAALDPPHPTFLGGYRPSPHNPHSDRFRTRRMANVHAMFRHWMQPMVVCSQPEKWSIT